MSEYDTMNALWQKVNVHGDATPAEKAQYEALLAKNRSAQAGTNGLATTGGYTPAPGGSGGSQSSSYQIGNSKYNPNPAPSGSSDSTYQVSVHGIGPDGKYAYNVGTAVYSNEGVPLAGTGVQHDGTRVVQYAAKPGYENYTPMLARGGNISEGGSAIVGDAGAELLSLPKGAKVTPLTGKPDLIDYERLADAVGSRGGVRDVHLHIQNLIGVPDKASLRPITRVIKNLLDEEQNRRGVGA
jgi:hypothetical protein